MMQRHLFDAGNVIEYDSDDWRNCARKKHITIFVLDPTIDSIFSVLCPYHATKSSIVHRLKINHKKG